MVFSITGAASACARIAAAPHLVVLRTLSKAWAAAGLRCGAVVADPAVIDLLRRAGVDVTVASLTGVAVTCSRGVHLVPDCALDTALERDYDALVLPGGLPGADYLAADERIIERIRAMDGERRLIGAPLDSMGAAAHDLAKA